MDKEEELKKEIKDLEEKLEDREEALPAHSVRPHQILLIEEKKNELTNLRKRKSSS